MDFSVVFNTVDQSLPLKIIQRPESSQTPGSASFMPPSLEALLCLACVCQFFPEFCQWGLLFSFCSYSLGDFVCVHSWKQSLQSDDLHGYISFFNSLIRTSVLTSKSQLHIFKKMSQSYFRFNMSSLDHPLMFTASFWQHQHSLGQSYCKTGIQSQFFSLLTLSQPSDYPQSLSQQVLLIQTSKYFQF